MCLAVGTAQLLLGVTRGKGWAETESTAKGECEKSKMRKDKLERAEIQTSNSKRDDYSVSPHFKFLGGQF